MSISITSNVNTKPDSKLALMNSISETESEIQSPNKALASSPERATLRELSQETKHPEEVKNPEETKAAKEIPVKTGIDHAEEFLKEKGLNNIADTLVKLADGKHPLRKFANTWLSGATAGINLAIQWSPLKDNAAAKLIGSTAYRAFLLINCGLGAITGLKQNRAVMFTANAIDIPFAFLPTKWIYSARRLYAGLMEIDNTTMKSTQSPLKPAKGKPFNSMGDSLRIVSDRLKELPNDYGTALKTIMNDDSSAGLDKLKRVTNEVLLNNKKGFMGFLGAGGALSGVAASASGNHSLGKVLGDVVGMSGLVLDRASLQNLEKGRLFNWLSGVFFGLGAVGDLTGETHLQMGSDALAKIFTQSSNARNEVQRDDLETISSPFKNPAKFLSQVAKGLKDEFFPSQKDPK